MKPACKPYSPTRRLGSTSRRRGWKRSRRRSRREVGNKRRGRDCRWRLECGKWKKKHRERPRKGEQKVLRAELRASVFIRGTSPC